MSAPIPFPELKLSPEDNKIDDEDEFNERLEDRLLLAGPNGRRRDFKLLMGVVTDFLNGFRTLHFVGPCITVFGSARFKEDHPYYKLARQVGSEIVKLGFTVMTGGGPGIMEAANRGAKDVNGRSVGCNIILLGQIRQLPLLLRPQNTPHQIQLRLRHHARRLRHHG
jgi:hypothetical protein